jgi:hypothetical protein
MAPIERSTGWTGSRRDRMLAILGALAGALAVSGALLTWVTVQKRHQSTVFRGTSFGVGTLALAVGIVMVAAAVVWIVTSGPRIRAAAAVAILACGAAATISIGTGLATKGFFDQATAKKGHHHKGVGTTPSPSGSGVGAAYVPGSLGSETGTATGAGTSSGVGNAGPGTSSVQPGAPVFQALAKGAGKKAGGKGTTSTLAPGVFIALAGGVIGMIVGIWALLGGRTRKQGPVPGVAAEGTPAPTMTPPAQDPAPSGVAPTPEYATAAPPDEPPPAADAQTHVYATAMPSAMSPGEPTQVIPRAEGGS